MRPSTVLSAATAAALLLTGCSTPSDGPLSGPSESAEKCLGRVPEGKSVIYTTNLDIANDVSEVKITKVKFLEPKNIEMLDSSITPRTDVIPVGIGYVEDADSDWPQWKERIPAESGVVQTSVTLLVVEARQIQGADGDASAQGLLIEYEVDGKPFQTSSTLAFRISAKDC